MNKRIKKLAEQAGCSIDGMGYGEGNVEKFAELIVRECMSQIEEVKQLKVGHAGPEYNQGFDDGMFVAIRTIEEHFGG